MNEKRTFLVFGKVWAVLTILSEDQLEDDRIAGKVTKCISLHATRIGFASSAIERLRRSVITER
jgi:hypothetical protein